MFGIRSGAFFFFSKFERIFLGGVGASFFFFFPSFSFLVGFLSCVSCGGYKVIVEAAAFFICEIFSERRSVRSL